MTQQYRQPTASTGQQSARTQTGQQSTQMQTGRQPTEMETGRQSVATGQQSRTRTATTGRGGQFGRSHRTTHETVGQQFESELTVERNEALESFDRVVEIAEWCADKCIRTGPEMAECARFCEDVADLAELNEKLIARDSVNGPEVAETFLRVAEQGLPILQQHQQSPHVQETYQAVTQAMDATERLLNSIGGSQRDRQMGAQEQIPGQSQSFQPSGTRGQSFQTTQPY